MDKNTGQSGQYTTVGDLFNKTIDNMFQDKSFLAKLGKEETSSLNNSQGQVSISTQFSAIESLFFLDLKEIVFSCDKKRQQRIKDKTCSLLRIVL